MGFQLRALAFMMICGLSACGTTFSLPSIDTASQAQATKLFSEAKSGADRATISEAAAKRRFSRVSNRVKPVAEKYCEILMADRDGFNCKARVEIDTKMKQRNAYFTYDAGQPVVRLSMPLLRDTANDDEVAFVIGHEYGHLLGRHIEKTQQQQVAGAVILGAIAAYANAQTAAYGGYTDPDLVTDSMDLGMAIGTVAYSQTYELESDTLGTHIAHSSGYDPVRGAKFFARPAEPKREDGKLSFWGTHPPDEKRIATVIAARKQIEAGQGLVRKQP